MSNVLSIHYVKKYISVKLYLVLISFHVTTLFLCFCRAILIVIINIKRRRTKITPFPILNLKVFANLSCAFIQLCFIAQRYKDIKQVSPSTNGCLR